MKITDLTPEMAENDFKEFFDTWLSTWAAVRLLQDTHRSSHTDFKGYVANDLDEEGEQ